MTGRVCRLFCCRNQRNLYEIFCLLILEFCVYIVYNIAKEETFMKQKDIVKNLRKQVLSLKDMAVIMMCIDVVLMLKQFRDTKKLMKYWQGQF